MQWTWYKYKIKYKYHSSILQKHIIDHVTTPTNNLTFTNGITNNINARGSIKCLLLLLLLLKMSQSGFGFHTGHEQQSPGWKSGVCLTHPSTPTSSLHRLRRSLYYVSCSDCLKPCLCIATAWLKGCDAEGDRHEVAAKEHLIYFTKHKSKSI